MKMHRAAFPGVRKFGGSAFVLVRQGEFNMLRKYSLAILRIALSFAVFSPNAMAVDTSVVEAEKRRVEIVKKIAPSVVAIFARGGQGGGSGVLVSPEGYALTNFHVTSSAGTFMKCGLSDGVLYDAVIVGIDPTGDVAVVKLLGRDDFPFAKMGDSDKLHVGHWAYAMGNPFLLATDFQPTVTYGIISGVHRYQYPAGSFLEYADCIQIDTSINPGNSGGPLFNDDGELVGINGRGSFEKRGRVNSGAGYAISINQIRHFMDHLKSGRVVDHATLGATVVSGEDGSVVIGNILEESEAYRRGLRIDDEIVSFAGRQIRSVNQFKNVLGIYPKGWKIPLVYRREDQKHEVLVRLRALHRKSELTPKKRSRRPQPRPKPKDDKDKKDPKNPGGKDKKPKPVPATKPAAAGAQAPEKYKHLFIKKEGYANFYFNKLQQDRLLKALQLDADQSQPISGWQIFGRTKAGHGFSLKLTDRAAGLLIGEKPFYQPLGVDDDLKDEPRGTGGLLVAMHHFRLLMTEGTKPFSTIYYLGSEPLDGRGGRVDVLVTVLTAVETHWYFSKKDGSLIGFDTRLSENADECEVRFNGMADIDGRKLPKQFTARSGGTEFATFNVAGFQKVTDSKAAGNKTTEEEK